MEKLSNIDYKTNFYNDLEKQQFFLALKEFSKEFGCYYIAYLCEDIIKKTRVVFTSNPDWQQIYIENHLVEECHLWKTVVNYFIKTQEKHFILPWEVVKPEISREKDVALYRREIGIGDNGISFCLQNIRYREYFAFAPEINTTNFVKYVCANIGLIKKNVPIFRKAFARELNKNL